MARQSTKIALLGKAMSQRSLREKIKKDTYFVEELDDKDVIKYECGNAYNARNEMGESAVAIVNMTYIGQDLYKPSFVIKTGKRKGQVLDLNEFEFISGMITHLNGERANKKRKIKYKYAEECYRSCPI